MNLVVERDRGLAIGLVAPVRGNVGGLGGALRTGGQLRLLEGHEDEVRGLTFLDDGRRALSGDKRGHLIVWELNTARPLHRVEAPSYAGHLAVALLPNGRRVVTSHKDGSVRLWLISPDAAAARDLARVGKTNEAAAAYARAVQSSPDDVDLKIEQARFFGRWGRCEEADAAYDELAVLISKDPPVRIEQALCYARAGEHDQAATIFDRLAETHPEDTPRWFRAGWWVVGPYPENLQEAFPPETNLDPLQPVAGVSVGDSQPPIELRWRPAHEGATGYLNLKAVFNREHISAYALLQVYSPEQRDVAILLGSDDGMRFWVNGELLHRYPHGRQAVPDDDAVGATLSAGWNTLLAKVVNDRVGHGLYLRISTAPLDLARAYNRSQRWAEALAPAEYARPV